MKLGNLASASDSRIPNAEPSDVATTLLARDSKGLSNYGSSGVLECQKIGGVLGNHQAGSVYDKDKISPTLMAGMTHGNTMPFIVEEVKVDGK